MQWLIIFYVGVADQILLVLIPPLLNTFDTFPINPWASRNQLCHERKTNHFIQR